MNRFLAALLVAVVVLGLLPDAPGDDAPTLKPTNLDKVNTAKDEDDPHITSDGRILLYTSGAKGKVEPLMSQRTKKDAPWGPGKPVIDLFRHRCDYRGFFLSLDGKYPQHLYFACNYDPEAKDQRGDNYDIYYLIRQGPGAEFTTPTAVINVCTEGDELHPWVSADDRVLYFSRRDKDGWRVYQSSRPAGGGGFGKPVPVDLPPGFHHATLDLKGQTMYLQGPVAEGRWGLFRSRLVGGKWSKPEPLTGLNHPEAPRGDRSPCLSRDGERLYFASDRPGGKGGMDLYVIAVAALDKKK
jgi:hypothetical protein